MSGESIVEEENKRLDWDLLKNPNNIHILSELAHRYASQADYPEAIQYYERIVRIDIHNGKAWIALGHCYLLKGDYHKCFEAYQSAIKKSAESRDPHLWYGVGLLYSKFDSLTYAESAFQSVLKYDPDFDQKHDVLYKLGEIYKQKKKFISAVNFFNNAINCPKISFAKKIQAMCNIGNCRESEGNFNEAFKIYYDALKIAKNSFKVREYIGFALMNQKFYQEALEMLGQALEFAKGNCPEIGDIYYLIGRCHLEMKNYLAGIEAFQKSIYKNPCVYIYWISTGILYALSNQPQDAFECFVKASEFNPENDEVWFNMGILYEQCKQKQEACLAYQRCYKLNPNNIKAKERKNKLKQVEDYEHIPSFVHPYFEISEIPFSNNKNEGIDKKLKKLPDIAKYDEKISAEVEEELKNSVNAEKTANFEVMDKDVTSLISDIRPNLHNPINDSMPDDELRIPMALYVRYNPQAQNAEQSENRPELRDTQVPGQSDSKPEIIQPPSQNDNRPGIIQPPLISQNDNRPVIIQPRPANQTEVKPEIFSTAQMKSSTTIANSFQNFLKSQVGQGMPNFFNPALFSSPVATKPPNPSNLITPQPISNPQSSPNPFSPQAFPYPFNPLMTQNPFNPSNSPTFPSSPTKPASSNSPSTPNFSNPSNILSNPSETSNQNPSSFIKIPDSSSLPSNNSNPTSNLKPQNPQEIPNFPQNPLGIPPPTPQQWAAFKNFMANPMMAAQMMYMGSVGFMNFMKFMKNQARANIEENQKNEVKEEDKSPQKRESPSDDTPVKKRKL